MARAIAALLGIGLAIGILGGLFGGEQWVNIGTVVIIAGVVALLVLGLIKDPTGVLEDQADIEAMSEGAPPQETRPAHAPQRYQTFEKKKS